MECSSEIIEAFNKPISSIILSPANHLIFYKYASPKNFKYSLNLMKYLCQKTSYKKNRLFHLILSFYLKILKACGNTFYFKDIDLLIICCFYIGVKASINQKHFLPISKLKSLFDTKKFPYSNEDIKDGEILCLKLLKYNINILTSYDYIYYLLSKNNKIDIFLLEESVIELESKIQEDIKDYIICNPKNIAEEIIAKIKSNIIVKINILSPFKLIKNNSSRKEMSRKTETSNDNFIEKKIGAKILHNPTRSMAFIERNTTYINEIFNNEKNNNIIYQKKSGRNIRRDFSKINRQIFVCSSGRNLNTYKIKNSPKKNLYNNNENFNSNQKIIKFQHSKQNELNNYKLNNTIFKKPSITNGQSCYINSRDKRYKNTEIKNIKINFSRLLSNRIINNYRIDPVSFLGICKSQCSNNNEEKQFATDSRNSPYKHKIINTSQLIV